MTYPFSAVEGQEAFKLALVLSAINPMVGGVLVSGPKGLAKSTLAKAFSEIIPRENSGSERFVDVPLSVSEEMLVGSLNLHDILNDKQVNFQEGLLAKAHDGVLYVDEVNLLPDNIVDLLLDVSVSGINIVERDGISHKHQAKFILLGTMNPDEGELRPQLKDRFGLYAQLEDSFTVEQRMKIVLEREAFDCQPTEFCTKYQSQQEKLISSIIDARENVKTVFLSNDLRKFIAEKCIENRVEGMRADIVWYRAAIAHAALCQRKQATADDVLAVEELVLGHRRRVLPNSSKNSNSPPDKKKDKIDQKKFTRPKNDSAKSGSKSPDVEKNNQGQSGKENPRNTDHQDDGDSGSEGAWGQMDAEPLANYKADSIDLTQFNVESLLKPVNGFDAFLESTKFAQGSKKRQKGPALGGLWRSKKNTTAVNWFSTLLSNNGSWPLSKLVYKRQKLSRTTINLILLDTSASILSKGSVDKARSVVKKIGRQAYFNREALTVIGFGNQMVSTLISRDRAPKDVDDWFDSLSFNGGTPLVDAINKAQEFQYKHLKADASIKFKTFVISDGKTTDSLEQLYLQGDVVIIDSEFCDVKRGKCQELSDQLGATYFSLASITS